MGAKVGSQGAAGPGRLYSGSLEPVQEQQGVLSSLRGLLLLQLLRALRQQTRGILVLQVLPEAWASQSLPSSPPPFPPGNLAGQLLDPVEECVCSSPVQRLWAEQGHAPAGMATSRPLAEEGKKEGNRVRDSRLDRICLGDAGGMRTGLRGRANGEELMAPHRLLGSSQWKSTGQLLKSKL